MLMYRGKIRCSVSLDILEKEQKLKHYFETKGELLDQIFVKYLVSSYPNVGI